MKFCKHKGIAMNSKRRFLQSTLGASCAGTLLGPRTLFAQPMWRPSRPVSIVVPYSPGGGVDTLARLAAKELSRIYGQSVVVENNPGADGLIGSRKVAEAKPDGHSLLIQIPSLTLNAHLPGFKGIDPATQLMPISVVATLYGVIVAHPAVPGNSLAEVFAACKNAPQPCSFGTTEAVARLQGQKIAQDVPNLVMVNYKGGGQLTPDLLGNNVNMAFMGYTAVIPHVKAGRVKVIATVGPRRLPVLPDAPTTRESGYPQLESETWYGLFAPPGTPQPIIDSIAMAVRESTKAEDFQKGVANLGGILGGNTPTDFAEMVKVAMDRHATLVKQFPIR
jgi:tripartite-type tricarboxylate transporter receptor subunit TctC